MLDFLYLPKRPIKPRNVGVTLAIDRGAGVRQVLDLLETSAPVIDLIKLGWGTGYVTANLSEKIALYKNADIPVFFGGTLFEIAALQGRFEDFRKMLLKFGISHVEVSNGIFELSIEEKTRYIRQLCQDFIVLSEVGSKDDTYIQAPYLWVEQIQADLDAGAWKIIAEAREGGNAGICRSNGEIRYGLIDEIISQIDPNRLIFEAPQKSQQTWFINKLGYSVNLGNIGMNDVIPLETLRLGLRGDTARIIQKNS